MRILYLDIDALRPDHLGCYGYARSTSPHIDRIAREAWRFDHCYASDVPCCPSRTSLFSGRFGVNNGVVCHAGVRAEPYGEGAARSFQTPLTHESWMGRLRQAGYHTASISSFGERHSAWWWYAGFSEVVNPGGDGMERADEVTPHALDWLDRRGRDERWFLHLNFWDVHTPYRTPDDFGQPFANDPLPAWLTEDVRAAHWEGCGPQCAHERGAMNGSDDHNGRYPRQPHAISDTQEVRRMFDGYDTAIRYVDHYIGLLLSKLEALGVLDDTAIVISADHGETLGELNIYGCHQTADGITTRLPMIVRWPGLSDRPGPGRTLTETHLCYHVDIAATVAELAGATVPDSWDGQSFAQVLTGHGDETHQARPFLVMSQMQGACQRSVRFRHDGRELLFMRTYHDGLHDLPPRMLFDLGADPHHLHDLASDRPDWIAIGEQYLRAWGESMGLQSRPDPMATVLAEGGPPHSRNWLPEYLERLRSTDREAAAARLEATHGRKRPIAAGDAG